MTYTYQTHGTCSREIILELDGDTVRSVKVIGGCSGNLQGIAALAQGMKVDEVIERLGGIRCGYKTTSCPDQISKALIRAREKQQET